MSDSTTSEALSARGVPKCELIEDVDTWLTKEKMSVEEAEVVIREKYGKYKYVESSMAAQKQRMSEKIPEFDNSLSIIDTLIAKRAANESFETTFMLSDDVYSKAVVQKPETVSVWLGANVMVEYDLESAKKMLEKNRNSVQKVVDELSRELAYIKDQITTTEVNMSYIVNYGVAKRRAAASAVKA
uniref:Prefoldin subunit 3 n=2 Tax=Caenorhabditis japonica TaxID=281687 RepID=A0A8R1HYZ0_CAEJA